ncbi:hypothetical protein Ddc_15434 [Ditylenchus destructor]|nr:hypothetical protein Ddc_15434 [Ditylenchus destructor]
MMINGYLFWDNFGCMNNETLQNSRDVFNENAGICQSDKVTIEGAVQLDWFEICDDGDLCNEKPLACAGYVWRKNHALLNLLTSTLIVIIIYHLYQ